MDGKKCYCVVKIDADDNEDVAVISSTWLNAARTTAAIPRLPGSSYYRHARNHLQSKSDDPKLPVSILVTTIDFEHAREMEIRYTCGNLPSSDDTINMGLPQKRRIKPPRFADDDSDGDYNAKKRNVGPTAVTYSVPSCSTKHRIPDSDATHGAHTIVQNDNRSYFGEAVTKTDFQHLSSSFHTAINELSHSVNVQLNALRVTIERLTAEITRLVNKQMPSLPLSVTSVTQLQETDRKMLDPKFHSTMADYFRGISAPSAGALLRNMLERLMTRAVAAQITYSCAHHTFAFKRTQLKAFLLGQTYERKEYATTPDNMLNEYCKGWLHCARDKRHAPNTPATQSVDVSQENIRIVDLDEQDAFDQDAD